MSSATISLFATNDALSVIKIVLLIAGLFFSGMCFTVIGAIALGGFKIGRLRFQRVVTVSPEQLSVTTNSIRERLAALEFQVESNPDQFFQIPGNREDLTALTHAKQPKQLDMVTTVTEGVARVELSLRYLSPIIGDTGESAYANAVLDYVSSETDTMKVVPHLNLMAFSTFVFAIWSEIALFGFKYFPVEVYIVPFLVLSLSTIQFGKRGLEIIKQKPTELRGRGYAITGIIGAACALIAGSVWAAMSFARSKGWL